MLPISLRSAPVICGAIAMLTHSVEAVEVRQVTRAQTVDFTTMSSYHTPVWSPDGQSLVLAAPAIWDPSPGDFPPTYENWGILGRFDLHGNLESWLWSSWWAWRPSPNPGHTLFAVGCHANLFCVDVCVVDPEEVTQGLACLWGDNPAWSPDGLTILTETGGGLLMFSPSGGDGIPFTTGSGDRTPAWSPQGTHVVFSSTQGGTSDLWIKDVMTGATQQLTDDAAIDTWPAWSSNGWIAFVSDRDGAERVWAIPAAGGNAVRVADLTRCKAPAWSPDGKSLAFESSGQVWVATELLDVLVSVEPRTWSHVKTLYRDAGR